MTANDLRGLGYTVDDTTTPGTWAVTGFGRTWTFRETNERAIATLVEISRDVNATDVRSRLDQAITDLDAAAQNWGNLTNAQRSDAMLLAVRVCARLSRIELGRFEAVS